MIMVETIFMNRAKIRKLILVKVCLRRTEEGCITFNNRGINKKNFTHFSHKEMVKMCKDSKERRIQNL